jgi:hypothetical protein
MSTDLTSGTDEPGTLRFNHESIVHTSTRSESISPTLAEPEMAPLDEAPAKTPEGGVILGLAIALLVLLRISGILREDERAKYEAAAPCNHGAPCLSCRFFSKNLYLQCAVRPADVLTDRAIHCPDYCSRR